MVTKKYLCSGRTQKNGEEFGIDNIKVKAFNEICQVSPSLPHKRERKRNPDQTGEQMPDPWFGRQGGSAESDAKEQSFANQI